MLTQDKNSKIDIEQRHSEELEHIRSRVWELQDRSCQLKALKTKTAKFASSEYRDRALERVNGCLEYIFGNDSSSVISTLFEAPDRIGKLLSHTPCVFTMFPGLGTHETLSQYDIVLVDRYSKVRSRSDVDLKTTLLPGLDISAPILVANMRSSIGEELAEKMIDQGLVPVMHRFRRPLDPMDCDSTSPTVQSEEEARAEKLKWVRKFGSRAFFSCGTRWESIEFTKQLIDQGALGVCVDIALGNSAKAAATVIELRKYITQGGFNTKIMAGNVDSAEGYFTLALAGADLVKVGIGPGSACTTRLVTRAGAGQGSALMDIARAKFVYGENAPGFVADGGIEGPADILVALALQASAVMVGKLAARTDESGALKKDGKAFYFGEASYWARLYESGGVKDGMAVEGRADWLPILGSFDDLMKELLGGLRNAFPYYNAQTIPDLHAKFSIPQQLCDLILGGTTGLHKSAANHKHESGTRLGAL